MMRNTRNLLNLFKPAVILLFGVPQSAISLPVHFPDYQVQAFKDIRFLSAPTLNGTARGQNNQNEIMGRLKKNLFILT